MIRRQDLQFPEKDNALREDVHALGGLVGEVLRDQGGERLFSLVEGDRVAAIGRREGGPAIPVELVARTAGRDAGEARDLIRAFSSWFEVVNLAERVHRVRRRREYLLHSDRPQPGGIGDCMYRLKREGYDAQKVLELLSGVTIYPVFTSHPTESMRRTILRKHQQIADMMIERLDPTLTPFERRAVWERIRMEVTSDWQTEAHPRERLTVADEREHALFYLAEVIYRVVPALYEEIALWMQTVFGLPPEIGRMPLILRFGSWVGGDMDGNTDVHAKAIRETLQRQHQRVISLYYQECHALAEKLSQSAGRVGTSPELEARIAEYDILVPKAREGAPTRHDRMPYRIFLAQVAERLRTTYEGRPNHYESSDHFVRDIQLVASSLRENHGRHAGLFPVERLLCRALTFGFHLATLDVRQHASVHREVAAQGLARTDWNSMAPKDRASALCASISRDRGPAAGFDAVGRRTLAVFEAMQQARNRFGEQAIGGYIVSGTEAADDVLSVLLLARWANVTDRGIGEVPLDVVPLIETVGALEGAGPLLRSLLAEPSYRRHLAARGRRQTVLLGYSESNQAIGIAASRHAIYQAQVELMAAAAEASVDLTLFYGRGGPSSRGGGPIDRLVENAPDGATRGRLRATEQGEGISNGYGLRRIALRSFEKAVYAVAMDRVESPRAPAREGELQALMDCIARASRARYRALVHETPGFLRFFREATPIDVIERMQIGGRVASREGEGVGVVKPVPWVYAWMQSRHVLPGWFGIGSGLEAAAREHGAAVIERAIAEWTFLENLLADVELDLVRADLEIAAHYEGLAGGDTAAIAAEIRREHALARHWVTAVQGEANLLDSRPALQRAAILRAPYGDPMHLMQVDLLRRWRAGGRRDAALYDALLASVSGIALALQATG
ncbi:MAG TPA: phosphoenolpyruvate carboxylase [Steroidobacteraceae bacterium]|nr:phosphoenolpyruvate carboxylase [Steroidobacteraceae bacterium]